LRIEKIPARRGSTLRGVKNATKEQEVECLGVWHRAEKTENEKLGGQGDCKMRRSEWEKVRGDSDIESIREDQSQYNSHVSGWRRGVVEDSSSS